MAEEEIVILEAGDEEEELTSLDVTHEDIVEQEKQEDDKNKKATKKKKLLIIGGISIVVLLLIVIITIILLLNKKEEPEPLDINATQIAQALQNKEPEQPFAPSRLENMLKKANLLYERGDKMEALRLYEDIAVFNEALSQYNIGVAQMKEKNYEAGLESFKKAIANQENRTISAINAAVCALQLNKQDLFNYYIDLAYTYLPEESNSPLYSYYIGLVNYYKGQYYEALSALSHPSSESYKNRHAYISSKLLSFLGNDHLAINQIQKQNSSSNSLTLGMLYAKIGDYNIAKRKLEEALEHNIEREKALLALSMVEMKLGNFGKVGSLMEEASRDYPKSATKNYPIKATLKYSLFSVNQAQIDFKKNLFFNKEKQYSLLFYFAPYKVFNAKQTIDFIRKGSMNVFVDEIGSALQYLKTSSTISKVNIAISKGIKSALTYQIGKANEEFQSIIKLYPQHSILHYNLALTYAQLGNYSLAQKHFTSSYHLNPRNYLAGVFAAMCSEIVGKDNEKLLNDIKETLESDSKIEKTNLYMALVHLIENNQLSMARWMEEAKDKTPLNLTFDVIIAKIISNKREYLAKSRQLQAILPKDIVANILSFHAAHDEDDIKKYAKDIQIDFRNRTLEMDAFYYGPNLVKELYTKILQLGGLLHHVRNDLKDRLEVERIDVVGLMQALAYISIYTNDFEESFALYNQLIDEHKQQDTRTIFLGAVASIGAKHPENAIALLELSKLIDPKNLESRYGLGLLYQEVGNYEAAIIQFKKMGDTGFISKYFSFRIEK